MVRNIHRSYKMKNIYVKIDLLFTTKPPSYVRNMCIKQKWPIWSIVCYYDLSFLIFHQCLYKNRYRVLI